VEHSEHIQETFVDQCPSVYRDAKEVAFRDLKPAKGEDSVRKDWKWVYLKQSGCETLKVMKLEKGLVLQKNSIASTSAGGVDNTNSRDGRDVEVEGEGQAVTKNDGVAIREFRGHDFVHPGNREANRHGKRA